MSYQADYRGGGGYGNDRRGRGGGGGGGYDNYRRRDYERNDDRGRRKRRSRSRSRSPGGGTPFVRRRTDISTSREKSRDRERRRRKQQAECIRRAGGFKKLADSEGREPVRLFWDGFQWVAKTGASSALLSDPILVNSTRKLRRLYFGNLPLHLGLTEPNFQHIVYQEMKKRNFCNDSEENPVLCVWFAKDKGNYGFVEFASVEETERALTMDGMDCLGVAIKVSRPNDYSSATQQNPALSMPGAPPGSGQLLGALPGQQLGGSLVAALGLPQDSNELSISRIVCLKEIVQPHEVGDEEEYQEVLDDVREGCEQCGKTLNALIITPTLAKKDAFLDSGDVYLEFETLQGAAACLQVMSTRKYFDRLIRAQKVSSDVYENRISKYAPNVVAPPAASNTSIKAEEGGAAPGEGDVGGDGAKVEEKLDEEKDFYTTTTT